MAYHVDGFIMWRHLKWLAAGFAAIVLLIGVINPQPSPNPKAIANVCRGNLKEIQEAKAAWAKDRHLTNDMVEIEASDIFENRDYIRDTPWCPARDPRVRTYTVGRLREPPRCLVPGHTL